MTAYILDASIAAKWVLPSKGEPLAAESSGLLRGFAAGEVNLLVPDLFWPEIGNVLWKATRTGRISGKSAHEAIDWLQALNLPTSPTGPLIGDALTIAVTFGRSVYDSLYLALAIASARPVGDRRRTPGQCSGRAPAGSLAGVDRLIGRDAASQTR